MRRLSLLATIALVALTGCRVEPTDTPAPPPSDADATMARRIVLNRADERPTDQDIERARTDRAWRRYTAPDRAAADTSGTAADSARATPADRPDPFRQDAPMRATLASYTDSLALPLSGDAPGRAVLFAQILLDRAGFSPGQIDGRWGQNTEKAVFWLQRRAGLDATGTLDEATTRRLLAAADAPVTPGELLRPHALTAAEIEGPFRDTPDDVQEMAKLDALPYENLAEALGERFHAAPELLKTLNPGVAMDSTLAAGTELVVPDVRRADRGQAVRLVISDGGKYVHALDERGRVRYHFPATLGSDYDPSPSDTLTVDAIAPNPNWYYQPDIIEGSPEDAEEAMVPPGPNNAVGTVWMDLSKEHYGIHGTAYPATIGYAASAGCVRLTNWDAEFLADHLQPGIEVAFRDTNPAARTANK